MDESSLPVTEPTRQLDRSALFREAAIRHDEEPDPRTPRPHLGLPRLVWGLWLLCTALAAPGLAALVRLLDQIGH